MNIISPLSLNVWSLQLLSVLYHNVYLPLEMDYLIQSKVGGNCRVGSKATSYVISVWIVCQKTNPRKTVLRHPAWKHNLIFGFNLKHIGACSLTTSFQVHALACFWIKHGGFHRSSSVKRWTTCLVYWKKMNECLNTFKKENTKTATLTAQFPSHLYHHMWSVIISPHRTLRHILINDMEK